MPIGDLAGKYPLVMRVSLGFVLGWFGVNEILNPVYWSGYVPPLAESLWPFGLNLFVQLHGAILSILGLSLLINKYIRYAGFVSVGVLVTIIGGLIMLNGFNEIVVRDIGLLGLALAIWLHSFSSNK